MLLVISKLLVLLVLPILAMLVVMVELLTLAQAEATNRVPPATESLPPMVKHARRVPSVPVVSIVPALRAMARARLILAVV